MLNLYFVAKIIVLIFAYNKNNAYLCYIRKRDSNIKKTIMKTLDEITDKEIMSIFNRELNKKDKLDSLRDAKRAAKRDFFNLDKVLENKKTVVF